MGSGDHESELRSLAAQLGLQVEWHGECRHDALRQRRKSWCCQVVPSRYDGWGVVVNESLSSGTPVVVSDGAGAHELVRTGFNGWVHSAGNVASIRQAVLEGLTNGMARSTRIAAARMGALFSTTSAVPFLTSVFADPGRERSFLAEQWAAGTRHDAGEQADAPSGG